MISITRKPLIKEALEASFYSYQKKGLNDLVDQIHQRLLQAKIKFTLLEYAADIIFEKLPEAKQISFCRKVMELDTIGSNTIVGKILQLRSDEHFNESIERAKEFIIFGDQWYVCDIIGERVMGHSLLMCPNKTIPILVKMKNNGNKWLVRTIGVATHYAVKKGLSKSDAEKMFLLLLSLSNTTEFHTKKGIGWAAKTIAKFHPDIIKKYEYQISSEEVKQWFRTKIKIGLGRSSKYGGKYTH